MKDNGSNKKIVPSVLIIIAAILFLKNCSPVSALIKFTVTAIMLIAVLVVILCIVAAIYAVKAGKREFDKRNGKTEIPGDGRDETVREEVHVEDEKEVKKPVIEEAPEIKAAREVIKDIERMMRDSSDVEIKARAQDARCSALRVLDTLSEQNGEIKKHRQLFAYYIPTFKEILEKYLVIEKSGLNDGNAKEKALSSFVKLKTAFENMYRDLYSDEVLDLSVEEKALESIIKKDGLM